MVGSVQSGLRTLALAGALVLPAACTSAAAGGAGGAGGVRLEAERYELPNGMEVILHVDRSDPIVAVAMTFHVGSAREVEGEVRVVLRFKPSLAPIKLAVFPLMKKDGLPEIARKLQAELRRAAIPSFYDEAGSIGRRYRRQDEAGTPWCATIDGETSEQGTVTIRDRDTLEQVRVPLEGVVAWVRDRLV